MNNTSSMLLLGIGTAGSRIVRGVSRAYGDDLRYALADTDATTGQGDGEFTLLGGDRLSGRGAGGNVVTARLAAEDSIQLLDARLEGVRLAVLVTCLGGGTGGGATLETLRRLAALGIPSIVFATTPFVFEGEKRLLSARGVMPMIEESANATFFLPLDKLVAGEDNMEAALRRAVDTVASGVTLFWRLLEKPGFIRLDAEHLRHLVANAGRGRFATVTVQGPDRAAKAVDQLVRSELLATASAPVTGALCGVLAGDDLRLSEVGCLSDGIRKAFGSNVDFHLGTVNDEETFGGRLSAVVMLFEANGKATTPESPAPGAPNRKPRRGKAPAGTTRTPRFNNAEPTIWNGEDLDIPTYVRRNISLEF